MLVDTHCHIHEDGYPDPEGVYRHALETGVETMICVGTSEKSSEQAVNFANTHNHVYAAVGVHPHEAQKGFCSIFTLPLDRVVAIGEIGLDYFYDHSPKEQQLDALLAQLQFAQDQRLPVIFHVREAFPDFWPIFDNFSGLKGVLHSFTDSADNLAAALDRGMYIGVNGISTFAKEPSQRAVFDSIPLDHLLLETDAPFLTPIPFRGKVNQPAFVRNVAEHNASRRGMSVDDLAAVTTTNANVLFQLN